jgi:hypothetical protein
VSASVLALKSLLQSESDAAAAALYEARASQRALADELAAFHAQRERDILARVQPPVPSRRAAAKRRASPEASTVPAQKAESKPALASRILGAVPGTRALAAGLRFALGAGVVIVAAAAGSQSGVQSGAEAVEAAAEVIAAAAE